jgi:hypothetical protein
LDFNVLYSTLISGKFINNIVYNSEFPSLSANIGLANYDVSYNFIHQNNIQSWNSTNIDGYPGFVDESDSTGVISNPDSIDWSLSLNSVCVNVGSPVDTVLLDNMDFAGNPRVSDYIVDMGAYELQLNANDSNLLDSDDLLFPNPSSSYIEVNEALKYVTSYKIISTAGQVVKPETYLTTSRIYIGDLERGCYFLEINKGDSMLKYIRFIKY